MFANSHDSYASAFGCRCIYITKIKLFSGLQEVSFQSSRASYYNWCFGIITMYIAQAWPESVIPINVMSEFRKCGIYPNIYSTQVKFLITSLHCHILLQTSYSCSKLVSKLTSEQEIQKCHEEGISQVFSKAENKEFTCF